MVLSFFPIVQRGVEEVETVTAAWKMRLLGAVLLGMGGWGLAEYIVDASDSTSRLPWVLALAIGGGVLGLAAAPYVAGLTLGRLAKLLASLQTTTILLATIGLILGLVIAFFLSIPFSRIAGWPGVAAPIGLSLLFGYLGMVLMLSRGRDLLSFLPQTRMPAGNSNSAPSRNGQILLDTSAIIDGRIADITNTGFLYGTLVIPRFVLDELRHIADSSDALRRNRGRRGLEMLNKLRKEADIPLQVLDFDVSNGGTEVDAKLVYLAKDLHAFIVTTDFNLNRVAELQGVQVLNINELANSLKPVVLPGEEMAVRVIQEGKEPGQGVGFLDDGTMVVVEGGRRYINSHLDVQVTRVLQTAAGRIIFAQPKSL